MITIFLSPTLCSSSYPEARIPLQVISLQCGSVVQASLRYQRGSTSFIIDVLTGEHSAVSHISLEQKPYMLDKGRTLTKTSLQYNSTSRMYFFAPYCRMYWQDILPEYNNEKRISFKGVNNICMSIQSLYPFHYKQNEIKRYIKAPQNIKFESKKYSNYGILYELRCSSHNTANPKTPNIITSMLVIPVDRQL